MQETDLHQKVTFLVALPALANMEPLFHDFIITEYSNLLIVATGLLEGDITRERLSTNPGTLRFSLLFPPGGMTKNL